MRPAILAILLCACAIGGAITAGLVFAPTAQAYTTDDLTALGFSVLDDNQNGCIYWSAGLPGFSRTLIGSTCSPYFQEALDNYITHNLPALQAWQAQHAVAAASVPTVTVTVGTTIYDSAGGTFTVTVTEPGQAVTAPAVTETDTVTATVPAYVTVTSPPLILTTPAQTVTIDHPAPPPETVTETVVSTETQTVASTRTVTVRVPVRARPPVYPEFAWTG